MRQADAGGLARGSDSGIPMIAAPLSRLKGVDG
jgi:hypothetical protein